MTQTEALLLALDAFEEIAWSNDTKWQSDRAKVALNTFKEILVEPEKKPHPVHIGVDVTTEGAAVTAFYRKPDAVMEMFYAKFHPMPQQEAKDEPVAWWIPKHKAPDMVSKVRWSDECEPLYTTPPQRTWIGLTETEVDECYESVMFNPDIEPTRVLVYQAIEAKLRSKNHD